MGRLPVETPRRVSSASAPFREGELHRGPFRCFNSPRGVRRYRPLGVNLGGVHTAQEGSIGLDAKATEFGLEVGQSYTFDLFQAERQPSGSNFRLATTLSFTGYGVLLPPDIIVKMSGGAFVELMSNPVPIDRGDRKIRRFDERAPLKVTGASSRPAGPTDPER